MEEYPPVPKKNPILQFLLYGIEFLGGAFVALIVFALLLVILNYFNLLPISDAFPKYLGWLPRQTQTISNNKSSNYAPAPSATPQGQFQYDVKKAQVSLSQYVTGNIKQEFLPTTINITQGQSAEGGKSGLPYEFGWYYFTSTSSISANLHFIKNTNALDGQLILMEINNSQLKESNITADSANNILNSYFKEKTAIETSNCKILPGASYCQIFIQNDMGKEGYGVILYRGRGIPVITEPHLILFSCFFSKGGNFYETQESCLKGF